MNEQCSWCSREGGLGNSSRSRSPDLAGTGGGLEPSSVPRLGKKEKITRIIYIYNFFSFLFAKV